VAWHEWNGDHFEIRGGRVSNQDGRALDPAGFTISGTSTVNQLYPRTASNGSNHLVVWWDGTSLRARRVKGSDGALLDGAGIALPATPGALSWDSPRFSVASDGTDYLVFWIEYATDTLTRARAARIRGSDGALLDTTPRTVAADADRRYYARLAFSGSHYLAVWLQGNGSNLDVLAARLAADGTVLDGTPRLVSAASSFTKEPIVAGDGDNMLVAWTDSGVKGRRLRLSDGAIVDAANLTLNASGGYAGLTFDGENFVAAWPRVMAGSQSFQLVLTRISRAGAVLDPNGIAVAPLRTYYDIPPSLSVGAGGEVLATYEGYDDSADLQTERIHARLVGVPVVPPDAAPPPPDAAPPPADTGPPPADDAAVLPPADAGTEMDTATPADAGVPMSDAGSPPPDGPPPPVDDAATSMKDSATAAPDAAGSSADGSLGADGNAPSADGATGVDATGTGGSPDGASARDSAAEGPGSGTGCECRTARPGQPASLGSLAFVALLVVARWGRRAGRRSRRW
jgi:hypothetical protein